MIGVESLAGILSVWRKRIKNKWLKAKDRADKEVNLIFKQVRLA